MTFQRFLVIPLLAFLPLAPAAKAADNGLEFNGVDDGVRLFDPGLKNCDFTIEFWVKRAEPNREDWILNSFYVEDSPAWGHIERMFRVGFNAQNAFFVGSRYQLATFPAPDDREWHHWVVTYRGKPDYGSFYQAVRVYRDAIPIGVNYLPSSNMDFGSFSIGNTWPATAGIFRTGFQPFKGMIDELRVWDGIRSQDQIASTMRREIADPQSQPLFLYCKFNEGAGAITNSVKPKVACELRRGDWPGQGPRWRNTQVFIPFGLAIAKGAIQATILPAEAAAAGAKWSADNVAWRISGEKLDSVPAGSYALSVQCPRGWRPSWPLPTVAVVGGQTAAATLSLLKDDTAAIGTIPPQTFRPGGAVVEFIVRSNKFAAGAAFSATADTQLQGSLSIADGLFRYMPSPLDKTPFTVAIAASKDGMSDSQSVSFTPLLAPTSEGTLLKTEKPLPDPASADYVAVTRTEDIQESMQNYAMARRVKVDIAGKTVVIAKDHPNGVYNQHNSDGVAINLNIREMNIMADVVIVRNKFRLPGTNLNIWARELRFEDAGAETASFDLSSKVVTSMAAPAGGGQPGADGFHGLPGGNATLHIQSISASAPVVRIVSNGGDGQPGGDGLNGVDGKNIVPINEGWPSFRLTFLVPTEPFTLYWEVKDMNIDWSKVVAADLIVGFAPAHYNTMDTKPENGTDALSPGKSGNGGDGGAIACSVDARAYMRTIAGEQGRTAPAVRGGAAGTPQPYYRIRRLFLGRVELLGPYYSTSGQGKSVPPATAGKPGAYTPLSESGFAWIHPAAAWQVAAYFRDACLAGQGAAVQAEMSYWLSLLSAYSAAPSFASLPDASRLDIGAVREDIRSMTNRSTVGTDFFGNVPGWVPMLSFEVAYAAFQQEIGQAVNTLYLNYWIGNAAKDIVRRKEAMSLARDNAVERIRYLSQRYDKAQSDFQALQPLPAENAAKIQAIQEKLKELDERLLWQADETINPLWKKAASCTLRVYGSLLSVIPIKGFDVAGSLFSSGGTILDSIKGGSAPLDWGKIVGMGLDGGLDALKIISKDMKMENDQVSTKNKIAKWSKADKDVFLSNQAHIDNIELISDGAKKIGDAFSDIYATVNRNTASEPEVQQELNRLRLDNKEFQDLKKDGDKLLKARGDIATRIIKASNDIQTIPGEISAAISGIEAMNQALAAAPFAIDARTTSHLNDMDRRARERLQLYHYYMAKAYEYRLLKQYPGQLDLSKLFEQFKTIAAAAQSAQLTAEQFNSLKALYQDQLSTVAREIIVERQKNAPKFDTSAGFELPQSMIEALNAMAPGETLSINLVEAGLFPSDKENLRVKFVTGGAAGITVDSMRFSVLDSAGRLVDPATLSVCNTEFELIHSGLSRLQLNGKPFRFQHYMDDSATPLKWVLKCDAKLQTPNPITGPASSEASLLRTLIGKDGDLDIYCYPAADAVINIKKGNMNAGGKDARITLQKLILKVDYEYNTVPSGLKILDVSTAGDLTPDYILGAADKFGRKDGQKAFRRVFDGGSFTITAPGSYAGSVFAGWTDLQGNILFDKPAFALDTSAFPNGYKAIQANYAAYGAVGSILFSDWTDKANRPSVSIALSGAASASTRSLTDGTFSFANLAPGVHTATPVLPNVTFFPDSRRFEIVRGQSPMTATLPAFQAVYTPCSIAGAVSGAPDAAVSIVQDGGGKTLSATVGLDGKYSFASLPPGTYTASPTKAGFQFAPATRKMTVAKDAPSASGIDFTGSPLPTFAISGSIAGNGAEGVVVTLRDINGVRSGEAKCMTDGAFQIAGVLAGLYSLTPAKAGFAFSPTDLAVQVVNSDVVGLSFSITQGAYSVIGVVRTISGVPVKGATVSATLGGIAAGVSVTDDTGAYSISGLKPGLYIVRPAKAATSFEPSSKPLSVATSDVPGVDFTATAAFAKNDFRGDGLSDVLVKKQSTGGVYAGSGESPAIYRRHWVMGEQATPAGQRSSHADWRAGSLDFIGGSNEWAFLGSAQFTGDEDSESLWLNLKDGRPYLYFDQWANLFAVTPKAIERLDAIASGDFDGDGKDDLLWIDFATCGIYVDLNLSGPSGPPLCTLPPQSNISAVDDFNGDGKADLLIVDKSTGAVRIILVNGRRVIGGGELFPVPTTEWMPVGTGDFDGDGKADIIWRNTLTGGLYIDSNLQDGIVPIDYPVPTDGQAFTVAETGDYDGDGYMDILLANPDGRQVVIMYMNGLTPRESAVIPITDDPDWSLVK